MTITPPRAFTGMDIKYAFSCGATPPHVPFLVEHLGKNIMVSSGGAIHSFVEGIEFGAKAFSDAAKEIDSDVYKKSVEVFGIPSL